MGALLDPSDYAPLPCMVEEPMQERRLPAVLVVEDEALIRMMVAETLEEAGFQVSEAANGQQALQLIATSGDTLRAVILDVGLPDIRGDILIEKIRAIRLGMPIIITTGYDTHALSLKFGDDAHARVVAKPYHPEILNEILTQWGITV